MVSCLRAGCLGAVLERGGRFKAYPSGSSRARVSNMLTHPLHQSSTLQRISQRLGSHDLSKLDHDTSHRHNSDAEIIRFPLGRVPVFIQVLLVLGHRHMYARVRMVMPGKPSPATDK